MKKRVKVKKTIERVPFPIIQFIAVFSYVDMYPFLQLQQILMIER